MNMSILDNENNILEDDSFVINEIKKWITNNIVDITRRAPFYTSSPFDPSKTIRYRSLFDNVYQYKCEYQPDYRDYNQQKLEYILNIDDKVFNAFVLIDLSTCPAQVSINGNVFMKSKSEPIPCKLFTIKQINGNLDLSYCTIDNIDGYPDRKNISGEVFLLCSKIDNNKYINE